MPYMRNGRDVKTRPYHSRLNEVAKHFDKLFWEYFYWQSDRAKALPIDDRYRMAARYNRLRHRCYSLTPDHFAYTETWAEKNWQRYVAKERKIANEAQR